MVAMMALSRDGMMAWRLLDSRWLGREVREERNLIYGGRDNLKTGGATLVRMPLLLSF